MRHDGDPNHTPPNSLVYRQSNQTNTSIAGTDLIQLPASGPIELRFNTFYETLTGQNRRFDVYVQFELAAEQLLASTTNGSLPSSSGGSWISQSFDLSAFAGERVYLTFRGNSEPSHSGWFIDDVAVRQLDPLALTYAWDNGAPLDGHYQNYAAGNPNGVDELFVLAQQADGSHQWEARSPAFLTGIIEVDSLNNLPLVSAPGLDVTVRNVAPVINIEGPSQLNEGEPATFTLLPPVDPGSDSVAEFIIDWNDGSAPQTVTRSLPADEFREIQVRHAFPDGPSEYVISVTSVDEDGSHVASGTFAVLVDDVAPTVALEGEAIALDGVEYELTVFSLVDPGADTVSEVNVDWGDGTTETIPVTTSFPLTLTHTFQVSPAESGIARTITVGLTDGDGFHPMLASKTVNAEVAVSVDVAGLSTIIEDANYELTVGPARNAALNPLDPTAPLDVRQYRIDWGDGVIELYPSDGSRAGTGPVTIPHIYGDPTTTTILVDVITDEKTYASVESKVVTVGDVAPTIQRVNSTLGSEGTDSLEVTVQASAATSLQYSFDFDNDGQFDLTTNTNVVATIYPENGSYTVGVRVRDEDGEEAFTTHQVQVVELAAGHSECDDR